MSEESDQTFYGLTRCVLCSCVLRSLENRFINYCELVSSVKTSLFSCILQDSSCRWNGCSLSEIADNGLDVWIQLKI